jgi:acyl-CoA reductase-like NAD-dependent aldehyde dehydrogenase
VTIVHPLVTSLLSFLQQTARELFHFQKDISSEPSIMTTNGSTAKSGFDVDSTIPLWLGGKEVTTSRTFDITSPVSHKKLYSCSSASEEDANAAVAAALKAFKTWSLTKPNIRRDIFLRAAQEFENRRDEAFRYVQGETGETEAFFAFEYTTAADACRSVAGLISAVNGSLVTPSEEGKSAMIVNEPYGVVLGIAPWNAPYVLGLRACLQPLAM